jgi:hypothetical protein
VRRRGPGGRAVAVAPAAGAVAAGRRGGDEQEREQASRLASGRVSDSILPLLD